MIDATVLLINFDKNLYFLEYIDKYLPDLSVHADVNFQEEKRKKRKKAKKKVHQVKLINEPKLFLEEQQAVKSRKSEIKLK